MRRLCLLLVAVMAVVSCGGDANSGNPVAPSNVNAVQGGWTGTLTRPGGQIVALRWDANPGKVGTEGFDGLVGPMTLTGPSTSTSVAVTAGTAGNDKGGYTLRLQFNDATPPSACGVKGQSAAQTGDPYAAPYTAITNTFTMYVVGDCRGVFDGGSQFTNLTETVRISLSK